jgi:hypothetical protein
MTAEAVMAKPQKRDSSSKRARARKPTASKVSKKMVGVRPLRGSPAIGRAYDPGVGPPGQKNPWVDEGEPEVNG